MPTAATSNRCPSSGELQRLHFVVHSPDSFFTFSDFTCSLLGSRPLRSSSTVRPCRISAGSHAVALRSSPSATITGGCSLQNWELLWWVPNCPHRHPPPRSDAPRGDWRRHIACLAEAPGTARSLGRTPEKAQQETARYRHTETLGEIQRSIRQFIKKT